MISKSLHVVRENAVFFFAIIALLLVLSLARVAGYFGSGQSAAMSILWLIVMWAVQRSMLLGLKINEKQPDGRAEKLTAFLGKGLVILLIGLVLSIPFIVLAVATSFKAGEHDPVGLLILVCGSVLAVCVPLALLGTWLPATVQDRNAGFGAALARGRATFVPVVLRLLGVNAICVILLIVILLVFAALEAWNGVVGIVLLDLATSLIGLISAVYMAVVLAETYLTYEHDQSPASTAG